MIVATAVASIGLCLGALWLLKVVPVAADAVATARGAVATMRDEAVDDAAREKAIQGASLRLLGIFASILVRSALAVGASLVPIWLADATGLAATDQVIGFLSRWDVVAIATVVIIAGYLLLMRWRRST